MLGNHGGTIVSQKILIHERQTFAYNAMYSQIIPYLSGEQKIEQGDVILIADMD